MGQSYNGAAEARGGFEGLRMRKTAREFEEDVFEAVRVRTYIELPPVLRERGMATVKLRFRIRSLPDGVIQFYYNEVDGKTSLALVVKETRSYGHDYTPYRGWHRHTWPHGDHDYSEEGRKPATIQDFVDEIIASIAET